MRDPGKVEEESSKLRVPNLRNHFDCDYVIIKQPEYRPLQVLNTTCDTIDPDILMKNK